MRSAENFEILLLQWPEYLTILWPPYHDLIIFVTPLFFMKKFYDPPTFSWPPYSVENDSPLKTIMKLAV